MFIKYTPELELAGFIPKVKTLVANSIEGLSLDKIAVSLFPATRINQVGIALQADVPGGESKGSAKKALMFVFILLGILGLAGGGFGYWYMKNKKNLKMSKHS